MHRLWHVLQRGFPSSEGGGIQRRWRWEEDFSSCKGRNTSGGGQDLSHTSDVCVSVPENPPSNVTATPNGTEVLLAWEVPRGKLNGELQGFLVEYSTPSAENKGPAFSSSSRTVSTGLDTVLSINLTAPLSNVTFRVCAYTATGLGPWTPMQTLVLTPSGESNVDIKPREAPRRVWRRKFCRICRL